MDAVNEVDYDYHNTQALKLSIDKRNRVSYELTTFKIKPGKKENKIERNLDIHISLNYETKVSVSESNKYYGEAARKHKYPVYIQYAYSEDNGWKYLNTNRIKRRFNNAEVTEASAHRYDPESNNPLSTSLKYNYSLSTYKLNTYSTNLADLLGVSTDFYLHCDKRKADAYLGYPYVVNNTYKIKIDKGSAFVLNEQFNQTQENAVGSIRTSIEKISDEEIKITLQYEIRQDYVEARDWCQYTELDNAYERFLKQLIIVTR